MRNFKINYLYVGSMSIIYLSVQTNANTRLYSEDVEHDVSGSCVAHLGTRVHRSAWIVKVAAFGSIHCNVWTIATLSDGKWCHS